MLKLTKDKTRNEIKLPLTLDHEQQKKLHNYAKSIGGLEMESSDTGMLEHKISYKIMSVQSQVTDCQERLVICQISWKFNRNIGIFARIASYGEFFFDKIDFVRSFYTGNDGYTIVYKKSVTPTVKNRLRQLVPTPNETTPLRLSESTIDTISTLVKDEPICNEMERCTNFESIETQSSDSQLPPMYSNTKPRIELKIPPFIKPIDAIKAVRESLPIYEYRDEILDTIGKHQVIVISGETGMFIVTERIVQFVSKVVSIFDSIFKF